MGFRPGEWAGPVGGSEFARARTGIAARGGNPILDWVRTHRRPLSGLLSTLRSRDGDGALNPAALPVRGHSLKRALLGHFADAHELRMEEASSLVCDVDRCCAEAMDYLVGAVLLEEALPRGGGAVQGDN